MEIPTRTNRADRGRTWSSVALRVTVLLALVMLAMPLTATLAETGNEHWVGAWGTALHEPSPGPPGLTNTGFTNQTLRQIVRSTIGGDSVRVRVSTFGSSALTIGAAHLALRADGASIVPESDRALTFGGEDSITVPPGAVVISDPVALHVPALADLAVTLYVPGPTGPAAWHFVAQQTSYISPQGDFTESVAMPVASTTRGWFWLAGIEVTAPRQTGSVVTFGDSVTDGAASTPDANRRWPDQLARRLAARPEPHTMGVLNQSITGNRLLHDGIGPNGLARFDRDVLAQTGVTHVIVLLGNNDIWLGETFFPAEAVTAEQIIQGHRQLIRRAHARGLTIYGATLTPLGGFVPDAVFPVVEAKRALVNAWIRTSGAYDAVIDFDAIVRDPAVPTRLLAMYDSGDHLHPNDVGYDAMGNAIDLKLFENGAAHTWR
jgi:lysophospholipase L1-like esterase